jgi:hypothetical protein
MGQNVASIAVDKEALTVNIAVCSAYGSSHTIFGLFGRGQVGSAVVV